MRLQLCISTSWRRRRVVVVVVFLVVVVAKVLVHQQMPLETASVSGESTKDGCAGSFYIISYVYQFVCDYRVPLLIYTKGR